MNLKVTPGGLLDIRADTARKQRNQTNSDNSAHQLTERLESVLEMA